MRRLLSTIVLSCLLATGPVHAAGPPGDGELRRLNESLVDKVVLPGYRRLAESAARLQQAATAFCGGPTADGLAGLRAAHGEASESWQGVQHFRFGPSEHAMRNQRIAFWPDPRNMVARQLDALLDKAAAEPPAADRMVKQSVAVQGLPALERLLFEQSDGLLAESGPARARCAVIGAIAGNLALMADGIVRGWSEGPDAYGRVVQQAGRAGNRYQSAMEVTVDFFKSLYLAVELVADRKLAGPLGESAKAARPRLAEDWRSGRSLADIRADLAAAQAMYLGQGGVGFADLLRATAEGRELDDVLRPAFAQILASVGEIGAPLDRAVVDPAERPKVEKLHDQASVLKVLLLRHLAKQLQIPVGFNALDGD